MDATADRFGGYAPARVGQSVQPVESLVPVRATAHTRVNVPMLLRIANISSATFLSRPERDMLTIAGDRVYEAIEYCLREQQTLKGDATARMVLLSSPFAAGDPRWVYALQAYAVLSDPSACSRWASATALERRQMLVDAKAWSTTPDELDRAADLVSDVCSRMRPTSAAAPSGHMPFYYHGGPVSTYGALRQVGSLLQGQTRIEDTIAPSASIALAPSGQAAATSGMSTGEKIALYAAVGTTIALVAYYATRPDPDREERAMRKKWDDWGVPYPKKPNWSGY